MNTRKVLRGRGTDAEHTTMPTFLMVQKMTRAEEHVDPDISMVRDNAPCPCTGAIEVRWQNPIRQDDMKPRDEDMTEPVSLS